MKVHYGQLVDVLFRKIQGASKVKILCTYASKRYVAFQMMSCAIVLRHFLNWFR